MAASSHNPPKDSDNSPKKSSDTVNLTPDELRRISGGAKIGVIPPTPTPPPTPPGNGNTPNPNT
ncbi:hypothetical protein [Paludisphaera borealis]|uniref:Uncharacterized protein n=1 Tax=Paludisphaera borealis TaxID=1387353 RepID=A0A1U7CUA5_9BACT|nr:hypothetical protein [Paludisphaera borealis]APW62515.1 hypothetical protein BSF38_04061 [Paludisphaera borealis]